MANLTIEINLAHVLWTAAGIILAFLMTVAGAAWTVILVTRQGFRDQERRLVETETRITARIEGVKADSSVGIKEAKAETKTLRAEVDKRLTRIEDRMFGEAT